MHKRWLIASVAVVVVGGGGLMMGLRAGRTSRRGPVAAFERSWPSGRSARFDLQMTATAAMAGHTVMDLELSGPLKVMPVELDSKLLLRVEFTGTVSRLQGSMDISDAAAREIQDAFHKPYFMEFSPAGELLGIRTTKTAISFVDGVWQDLATTLQFERSGSGLDAWETEEADSIGRYLARYKPQSASHIEKRKERYLKTYAPRVAYSPPQSQTTFAFTAAGALESLSHQEKVQASGTAPLPSFSSSTAIELRRVEGGDEPVDSTSVSSAAAALSLEKPGQARPAMSRAELDLQRTGGKSLDQVLLALRDFQQTDPKTASTAEKEQSAKDYVALAALLALHPEELRRVRGEIEKGSPMAVTLIAALRDARTPEAQAVLRDLLSVNNLDGTLRGLVARDLSRVEAPAPETVSLLRSLQGDPKLGVQATYGLGSNIHQLAQSDPSLATATLDTLTGQLTAAKSDQERSILLTALGNAGQERSLDAIEPQTTSQSMVVRAAAAQALRRIPGARAEGLLVNLARDTEPNVRFSAMDAISERSPSPALAKVVGEIALGDPTFKTRLLAAETAGSWLRQISDLRGVLETVAANDAKDDIRRIARLALDRVGAKI